MNRYLLLAGLAAFGCGDKDDTANTNTKTESCGVTAELTIPEVATSAYYRGTIEFELSDEDPEMDPTITLTGPSGDVAGSTSYSEDMETVIFTPNAPLEPNTQYTASLDFCGGNPSVDITTSELGGATVDVTGNAYVLDLASARFVEPAGVGDLLGEFLTMDIFVAVTEVTSNSITMMGALAEAESNPPVQDLCIPTFNFPAADYNESPFFAVGPADTTLEVAGYSIKINSLEVSGTFGPDGDYFGGAVLGGEVDARDIAGMFEEVETAEDACNLAATFGAPCIECSSDNEPYCLILRADQIVANQQTGTTIVEVLESCEEE